MRNILVGGAATLALLFATHNIAAGAQRTLCTYRSGVTKPCGQRHYKTIRFTLRRARRIAVRLERDWNLNQYVARCRWSTRHVAACDVKMRPTVIATNTLPVAFEWVDYVHQSGGSLTARSAHLQQIG